MTPQSIKDTMVKTKIQVVEVDTNGIIISSENTLITLAGKKPLADVHPFFMGIEAMLDSLGETVRFPCVNIETEKEDLIVDIELIPNGSSVFVVLFDFTSHYKDSHPLVQEKNESSIQKHKLSFERNLLIAKEEFKNNFLAHLNHEIRNPLNNLLGFMDILNNTKLDYDQKETLLVMQRTGTHLKVLMDDLLDISKIERGIKDVKHVNFNLGHILNNIQNHFGIKYGTKPIKLKIETAKNVPTKLKGDPVRLNQILFNLIENAYNNTTEGSISCHISLDNKVGKDEEAYINIAISDTGVGISEEDIQEIFSSYYQLELDKIKPVGQGLGLKIVKDLVNLLNGNVTVSSKENQGTSFHLTLPFEVRDVKPKRKSVPKGSGIMMSKRILIVENEEINQMLFMKMFLNNQKGYHFEIADTASTALKFLNAKKYDVIIVKMTMPDMEGLSFIEQLRNHEIEQIKNTPILMASGSTMINEQERSLSAGANAFLPKPYSKKELFNMIESVLKS